MVGNRKQLAARGVDESSEELMRANMDMGTVKLISDDSR